MFSQRKPPPSQRGHSFTRSHRKKRQDGVEPAMLSMRARLRGGRLKCPSDTLLACSMARENVQQPYVRIKRENGCAELIDLADSSDEKKEHLAGRFDVRCIVTDEGTSAEMIEFLSDTDTCADDGAEPSDAETIDLATICKQTAPAAKHEPTIHFDLPPVTVNLTGSRGLGDSLCEYEQIYVDLAQSSSSDDYESTDSSEESDEDIDGNESDTTLPRALVTRRRAVKTSVPIDKKALQNTVFTDITNLEIQKPWRFVYRCLDIPFESNPRTDSCGFLFERWDDFWRDHGRAVWERMYWKPMPTDCMESRQRRNRQCRAVKAFQRLANDIYGKFGAKLIELVKVKPHSGWWYRSKRPVNLTRLRCQDLRLYNLHLSRFRERWPFGVRHVRLFCNYCWCLPEATVPNDEAVERDDETDSDEEDSI